MCRVCELREKLEQYKNNRNPPLNSANDNPNYVVVHGENKKEEYDSNKKPGNYEIIPKGAGGGCATFLDLDVIFN